VVIEDGGEVVPPPANNLEIGEVGLPELVRCSCLVLELGGGLDDDEGGLVIRSWAFKPINR
jgi:hypothetical protein